ncbi:MAG: hypothetical protein NTV04_09020 [Deltaproteobacteria bacterium]|nr:hypothetical protein [Deltaproteobacteria bacterium]
MRFCYLWVLISVAFLTPSVNMAQEKGKADQEASFPAEVSGWKWDGKENHYNRKTIFDYINGAGELYIAYNFNGVKVRRYEKGSHPPITAEVYDMGTSEDAFGVFSFERQDEEAGIGQGSEFGGGLLRFWKGKFFVSAFAEGQGKEAEAATLDLGKAIANSIKSTGPIPKLLGVLPNGKTGLLEKSTRYFHSHILLNQRFFVANQNILNLNPKTEAVLGQYAQGQQKTHLLIIRYSEESEAAAALQKFKKTVSREGERA